uniref:Reverse transcriptase domain-containing protein n=1 Tax=Macrostomum lignano TaxID=282301 RepID=A0A1I8FEM9_9PLAT
RPAASIGRNGRQQLHSVRHEELESSEPRLDLDFIIDHLPTSTEPLATHQPASTVDSTGLQCILHYLQGAISDSTPAPTPAQAPTLPAKTSESVSKRGQRRQSIASTTTAVAALYAAPGAVHACPLPAEGLRKQAYSKSSHLKAHLRAAHWGKAVGRADQAPSEAHRPEALPLPAVPAGFQPLRSSGAAFAEAQHKQMIDCLWPRDRLILHTTVGMVLDWVLRTALPTDDDGFLLRRRVGRRQPEKRLSVLGYADDLALLSSTVEGAQRQLDRLVAVAASVGLVVNMQKTVVLCVPDDIEAAIFCRGADGQATELPRDVSSSSTSAVWFQTLARTSRRCCGLAWAAFRSSCNSEALPDRQRAALFQAVIETVWLYNAETWTLTDSLEQQVDAAHAGLLRAPPSTSASSKSTTRHSIAALACHVQAIYCAVGDSQLAGHLIRARVVLPTAGAGGAAAHAAGTLPARSSASRRYVDCLAGDAGWLTPARTLPVARPLPPGTIKDPRSRMGEDRHLMQNICQCNRPGLWREKMSCERRINESGLLPDMETFIALGPSDM